MTYQLELTDRQLDAILRALEFYQRVSMGQFKELFDNYLYDFQWKNVPHETRDRAVKELHSLLMTSRLEGAFCGIAQCSESARTCFDVYQVIRYRLSHDKEADHPNKGAFVRFDRPLFISGEPHPIINKKE